MLLAEWRGRLVSDLLSLDALSVSIAINRILSGFLHLLGLFSSLNSLGATKPNGLNKKGIIAAPIRFGFLAPKLALGVYINNPKTHSSLEPKHRVLVEVPSARRYRA